MFVRKIVPILTVLVLFLGIMVAICHCGAEDELRQLACRNNIGFIIRSFTRALKIDDDITEITLNSEELEKPEADVADDKALREAVKRYFHKVKIEKRIGHLSTNGNLVVDPMAVAKVVIREGKYLIDKFMIYGKVEPAEAFYEFAERYFLLKLKKSLTKPEDWKMTSYRLGKRTHSQLERDIHVLHDLLFSSGLTAENNGIVTVHPEILAEVFIDDFQDKFIDKFKDYFKESNSLGTSKGRNEWNKRFADQMKNVYKECEKMVQKYNTKAKRMRNRAGRVLNVLGS